MATIFLDTEVSMDGSGKKGGKQPGFSRRRFLQSVGVAGVGAIVAEYPLLASGETPAAADPGKPVSGNIEITLNVNGQDRKVTVEPRTTLLNALRNNMEPPLTGPKLVCDMATCGACTVLLNDKPVY